MGLDVAPKNHEANASERRDRLVLSAALGGQGSWSTEVSRQEVDYCDRNDDGNFMASVSIVLSLLRVSSEDGSVEHMHDETGSGRVESA